MAFFTAMKGNDTPNVCKNMLTTGVNARHVFANFSGINNKKHLIINTIGAQYAPGSVGEYARGDPIKLIRVFFLLIVVFVGVGTVKAESVPVDPDMIVTD